MTFESLPTTVRNELIDVCDQFEEAWKSGQRPRIEVYLGTRTEPERAELLRMLLEIEIEIRRKARERPEPREFLERFETDTEVINSIFDGAGLLHVMASETLPATERETGLPPPEAPLRISISTTVEPPREGCAGAIGPTIPHLPSSIHSFPSSIGRYRVTGYVGSGNFVVYRARDDLNGRDVAIKIARPGDRPRRRLQSLAEEAEKLKALDHPRIVKLYEYVLGASGEAGGDDDFLVMEYIEGQTLEQALRKGPLPADRMVRIVAQVADTVHHAHIQKPGVVHRDLKPSNILIDLQGEPHVCDFGLAVDEDVQWLRRGEVAGSLRYMAPEQVRGETHRLDGRTDIWALGVILYRGLTQAFPFPDRGDNSVLEEILHRDPKPLRMCDPGIDPELERICLRCLSRQMSGRYLTASDLSADLQETIDRPRLSRSSDPSPIVPKGLQPFDGHDAGFFLRLLPGPRDREGLPDSLRFWKSRIEATDPDMTFRVGMIYGPSGCGKSSLIKAGLLPRLAERVLSVYADVTDSDPESELLRSLRKKCPQLPGSLDLAGSLVCLRQGCFLHPGQKVLLVLDQFEQWLFERRDEEDSGLLAALRQCDGEHTQAIVLVRDDFWMAATRFMKALEIDLVSDRNLAAVDLFDRRHAWEVLADFGRAYGALPEVKGERLRDQQSFLDQAVDGLSQGGKVVPVRLALFAEMIKGKPWTSATLRDVGGAEGVGVTFLEETFGSARANPRHRLHQKEAQAVLKALLPEAPTDIRGRMRPEAELREAAGYSNHTQDFDELMHILVGELRLVTPADPAGTAADRPSAVPAGGRYYQLTHDYLVHSLHDWLNRKQRETWRGRAELLLADRAALWDARHDSRHLPPLPEYLYLQFATFRRDRSAPQKALMRAAGRRHGMRFALVAACLLALAAWGWDKYQGMKAEGIVLRLLDAPITGAQAIIDEMAPLRRWVDARLQREARRLQFKRGDPRPLNVSLALLPTDPGQAMVLRKQLLLAGPKELGIIRSALNKQKDKLPQDEWTSLVAGLWADLDNQSLSSEEALCAACGLAEFDPVNVGHWKKASPGVVACLLTKNSLVARDWIELLDPVGKEFGPELKQRFFDKRWSDDQRLVAATALAKFLHDDVQTMVDLAISASPTQLAEIIPALRGRAQEARALLNARFEAETAPAGTAERVLDRLASHRAAAAAALLGIDEGSRAFEALKGGPDPRVRTYLIHQFDQIGITPRRLIEELKARSDSSTRQALILALGEYDPKALVAADRDDMIRYLQDVYYHDPHPGVHSSAFWLLNLFRPGESLDLPPASKDPVAGRDWYVNRQGQTFSLIREPRRLPFVDHSTNLPRPTSVQVGRSYAVSTTEVTRIQFARVLGVEVLELLGARDLSEIEDPDRPVASVPYYLAAKYCRKLSELEGIDEDERCYPSVDLIRPGMTLSPDHLKRTGYRLPTEAEWVIACLANAETIYPFGSDAGMSHKYAWYFMNSENHSWPVGGLKPNDFGLFDILGNVYEWCEPFPSKTPIAADLAGGPPGCDLLWAPRGGSFTTRAHVESIVASYRKEDANPIQGDAITGFRVARTCPSKQP